MSALDKGPNQSCFGICNSASGSADDSAAISGASRLIPHGIRQLSEHDDSLETVEHRQQKKEMDALLCQTMENLSLEERKRQQEIVHGVDQVVEDVTLVDRALEGLEVHLKSIKHNSMYEVAERINAEYVNARAFQVMFLRANEYDAKASADQMLRFFESKYELFGIEKLVEDITLADLDEEDITCLKTGCIQLAGKDRSGRQVFVHFAGYAQNPKSWLRVYYFARMRALEDEETQLQGTIAVWWVLGSFKKPATKSRQKFAEGFRVTSSIPQKQQAIHMCMCETWQYVICNTFTKLFKGKLRMRFQIHFGSQMECQYQLSTFGIHPLSLRLDPNGRIDTQDHLNWVQSCAMEDKLDHPVIQPRTPANVTPSPNDVLFTGGTVIKHLGNKRFQSLIQDNAQAYDEGEAETKRQIASTVIETIHGSGGRFLQRGQKTEAGTTWKEVPHEDLRKKTMQAFRNRRKIADASKRKADDCVNGTLLAGEPLPNDVIFGRGQRNQGSELLHRLIKEHSEEYESLGRGVKMGLVETMMQTIIEEHDGRFLVKLPGEPDRWVELSHNNARDRISKCFRNYRRPPKASK